MIMYDVKEKSGGKEKKINDNIIKNFFNGLAEISRTVGRVICWYDVVYYFRTVSGPVSSQ